MGVLRTKVLKLKYLNSCRGKLHMKRKIVSLLLCGLIIAGVNGCGSTGKNEANVSKTETEQQKSESVVKEDQEISEEEKNGSPQGANIEEVPVEEQNGDPQGANIEEISVEEQNGDPQGL